MIGIIYSSYRQLQYKLTEGKFDFHVILVDSSYLLEDLGIVVVRGSALALSLSVEP